MRDDVVVLDSDVLSLVVLTPRDREPRVPGWRRLLLGRRVAMSAQTESEIRYGALRRGWSTERLSALEGALVRVPTLPVTDDVIRACAGVRAQCAGTGHPLAAKQHMGDAWVAATAMAFELPLLSGDDIFVGVPGLRRLDDLRGPDDAGPDDPPAAGGPPSSDG